MTRDTLILGTGLMVALWGAPGHAETLQFSRAECQQLVAHQPDADVAYQPGVDVQGRAVVPADLDSGPAAGIADTITIDITGTVLQELGLVGSLGPFADGARVARMTIQNGQVLLNGQPLNAQESQTLYLLCRDIL